MIFDVTVFDTESQDAVIFRFTYSFFAEGHFAKEFRN